MPLHIIISINIIEGGIKGGKQASKTTPHFNLPNEVSLIFLGIA